MLTLLWLALGCSDELDPADEPCLLATNAKVATADGATIALHHHGASGAPVLLVHGISSNHRFWDLDPEHSFARWLQMRGHDVWVLDLRGHGNARTDLDGLPQISGWTVDDYGRYDVAAAIEHIRNVTRKPKVAYVGHSMGGMVGSIYLGTMGDLAISSMVLVGSPGTFDHDVPMVELAGAGMAAGGGGLFWLETGLAADAAAMLGPLTPGRLHERLYNPEHFAPGNAERMLQRIVSPMSRQEMQHFGRMIRHERFESADGTILWTEKLAEVKIPVLGIAGGLDHVAHADWVRHLTESYGGPKQFVVMPEYGHLDLALGESASTEVWPVIEAGILAR